MPIMDINSSNERYTHIKEIQFHNVLSQKLYIEKCKTLLKYIFWHVVISQNPDIKKSEPFRENGAVYYQKKFI